MNQPYPTILASLIAFTLLFVMSCTVPKVDHIEIKPSLTKTKELVGNGVSMLMPLDYRRANSSDTFVTQDKASFIAVRISEQPVADLRMKYAPERLERDGFKVSELSTVRYGGNEEAFFVKVYNKNTSIFQYLLAIQRRGKTYLMEAECPDISHDFYDYKIRQSLLSTYID